MNLSDQFLKIAAIYFIAGSMLGLTMGIMQDFRAASVNAHLNLPGWASLALIGLPYCAHPSLTQTVLAKIHFWLYNIGPPVAMVALFFFLRGESRARPIVAAASIIVAIGIGCFAANVIRRLRTHGGQLPAWQGPMAPPVK